MSPQKGPHYIIYWQEMDGSEPRDVKNKMQGIAPRDNWQLTDWSDTYVIY